MTARNPSTFLVGAGPIATALAGALRLGGVPVLGLWARKPGAARQAASAAGVAAFSSAPPDVLLDCEVVVLAVRDDAVAAVAETLLGTGLVNRRHVLLHCSGAMAASEALGAVAGRVGGIGTLHPLRAIADGAAAARTMKGTAFGLEGDERGLVVAEQLVRAMGGHGLRLDGRQMAAYHAAAAMASNYLVALLDAAAEVLASAGLDAGQAQAALVPLAQGALDNVAARGLVAALTGPIRRGDVATVGRHLEALRGEPLELYRVLARRTLALAARVDGDSAPDPARLDAIRALIR